MTTERIGIIGLSDGALALASHAQGLGIEVHLAPRPGTAASRPSGLAQEISYHPEVAAMKTALGKGAAVFVFSPFGRGAALAELIAAAMGPGDAVFEMNSFALDSLGRYRATYTASGAVWSPLKLAWGPERDAPSILALADAPRQGLLASLAKRRMDGAPCLARLPSAEHLIATRAVYRGLIDTVLQGFADAVHVLTALLHLSPFEVRTILAEWNGYGSETCSPILSSVMDILTAMDEKGMPIMGRILDIIKLDDGDIEAIRACTSFRLPQPLSGSAFSTRIVSLAKDVRVSASVAFTGIKRMPQRGSEFIQPLRQAVTAAFALAYTQSLGSLQTLINREGGAEAGCVALAWAGSSLIQGPLLDKIALILQREGTASALLSDGAFQAIINDNQEGLRKTAVALAEAGIPVPVLSSALTLYDSLRSETLSGNLVAAGLDYLFGTGFERVDRPRGEFYRLDWKGTGLMVQLER